MQFRSAFTATHKFARIETRNFQSYLGVWYATDGEGNRELAVTLFGRHFNII